MNTIPVSIDDYPLSEQPSPDEQPTAEQLKEMVLESVGAITGTEGIPPELMKEIRSKSGLGLQIPHPSQLAYRELLAEEEAAALAKRKAA